MAFSTRHKPEVAANTPAEARLAVIVEVGEARAHHDEAPEADLRAHRCALWASDVVEVMRPLPIEGLADVAPFVLGVSVIRGTPTPVVDVAALLDQRRCQRPSRFVLIRVGERRVALAVASVLGVRPLQGDTLHALPPLLRNASDQTLSALGTLDAHLLSVLGAGYLLPPSVWEALAPAKAPA